LYVGDPKYQFTVGVHPPVPGDTRFNTHPDSYSQTSAQDMAVLLEEIYDCSEYGSGLRAVFPDSFNQARCKQMINLLSGNVIGRLIELGTPPGTKIAHKNGWGGTPTGGANASDAAIVYSPGGAYILVVYMWEPKANQDGIGTLKPWEAIEGISQITYNYFNPEQPMMTPRVPENPLGAIDCVMPNPKHIERLDLNNINNGRFDADGHIVPDACFNFPQCAAIPADKAVGASDSGSDAPASDASPATAPPERAATTLPPPK
ncbi:MAG TPA: serine hydrolase, partial [Aggregatilineales bacterium]|nr:serine hydrolase [Aggregatilineales bacterium]